MPEENAPAAAPLETKKTYPKFTEGGSISDMIDMSSN